MSCLRTAAILAALAFPVSASASPVSITIDSISALWTSASGNFEESSLGTDTLAFGDAYMDKPLSSYSFSPAGTSFDVHSGEVFALGEFTHNNFIIYLPAITAATLTVTLGGTIGDGSTSERFSVSSGFDFGHFETPNYEVCAHAGETICPDIVTPVANPGTAGAILFGEREYVFGISGFEGIGDFFVTEEEQSNRATLNGTFIDRPAVVPLPAALPFLLAGMGALAVAARRRKG